MSLDAPQTGMASARRLDKATALHVGVILVLFACLFILPDYHVGVLARVMVLAVFAIGYNILFGYTGLLSLGHAMFFAAGLYGAGMPLYHLDWPVMPSFLAGIASGTVLSLIIGVLALRTTGVAFMIVTLMFAQVAYLASLYFTTYTRGEEGLVLQPEIRQVDFLSFNLDLTDPASRYMAALTLLTIALFITLRIVKTPFGRNLVAIRENEERMRMLGYNVFQIKLGAVVISGTIAATAGAAYGLFFGYVGSGFAAIQYSILPLLWVLIGGAATTLGPLLGTIFMFYVIDITSGFTSAWLLIVGGALITTILFFPKGILGTLREKRIPWLP